MTWNGKQGFQKRPTSEFYVPYHPDAAEIVHDTFYQPIPGPTYKNMAGSGYLGITHHERGLTFCSVDLAGHEIVRICRGKRVARTTWLSRGVLQRLEFTFAPSLYYLKTFANLVARYF
jgi:hypothetical protein